MFPLLSPDLKLLYNTTHGNVMTFFPIITLVIISFGLMDLSQYSPNKRKFINLLKVPNYSLSREEWLVGSCQLSTQYSLFRTVHVTKYMSRNEQQLRT